MTNEVKLEWTYKSITNPMVNKIAEYLKENIANHFQQYEKNNDIEKGD